MVRKGTVEGWSPSNALLNLVFNVSDFRAFHYRAAWVINSRRWLVNSVCPKVKRRLHMERVAFCFTTLVSQ